MTFLHKKTRMTREALSTPAGEFLLANLLDFTGFYKQSFSSDPYQTAFNEGKRSVALQLIQMLDLKEEDLRNLVRGYREDMYKSSEGHEEMY